MVPILINRCSCRQKLAQWHLKEPQHQSRGGQDDEGQTHGPVKGAHLMMGRLLLNLSPREENDENQPKGVVSGEKDTEQPGRQPDRVLQAGQRCEDDLLAEKAGQRW